MSPPAEITNVQEYSKLLAEALPHVLHTEAENERFTSHLETLLRKEQRTEGETRLIELLTLLIEEFEAREYALPHASPVEVLRHLMVENNLRQTDLLDVFGSASVVSEVLAGRRALAKNHITKLSKRFNVSPALFF